MRLDVIEQGGLGWSTAQHSTAQHSTAQHSTAQHSRHPAGGARSAGSDGAVLLALTSDDAAPMLPEEARGTARGNLQSMISNMHVSPACQGHEASRLKMHTQADSECAWDHSDVVASTPEVQWLESGVEEGALKLGKVCGPVSQNSKPLEALPTVYIHAGKCISTQIGKQDTARKQLSKQLTKQ